MNNPQILSDFPWPEYTTVLPPTPRRSFELNVEGHTRTVKKIGDQFKKPDDDWSPMVILDAADDSRWLVPLGDLMEEEMKSTVAQLFIPTAIIITQAWCVGFVVSAWAVFQHHDPEDDEEWERLKAAKRYSEVLGEGVTPATSPDREEVVMLQVTSAEQTVSRTARIYRRKNSPPKLGKWQDFGKGEISGQFFDPIKEALKLVASS